MAWKNISSINLMLAGVKRNIFDDSAITAIHQGAGGLFRKANNLARDEENIFAEFLDAKLDGCWFCLFAVRTRLGNTLCDRDPSADLVPKQTFLEITRFLRDCSA